jgi:O-antigen ligase
MKAASWLVLAEKSLHSLRSFSWALFLFCLPVTSFPFFPKGLGGSALVRPLSIYPLLLLLLLVTLPQLLRKPVPRTLLVLAPFFLVALASSLLSSLQGIETTSNVTTFGRFLRALATLAIGAGMYFTVSLYPRTPEDLRRSLRWLYAGFAVALLWGSLQAIYVVDFERSYFHDLGRLQAFISTRKLFTTRVSGMTYEPNWFAEQISFLLVPWLLASILSGVSAFRQRWRFITVEWFLFAWAVVILAFTFSRAGIAILFLVAFAGFLFFRSHRNPGIGGRKLWLKRVLEAGAVLLVLLVFIYIASVKNPFFARIWNYWTEFKQTSLEDYFEYLGFGARFRYGEAAYHTFESHPFLGVGLGNYAFYFPEMMPDEPLAASPELLRLVVPEGNRERLITPKNFYLRLLAETGLVGLAAFLAFLAALLGCAMWLWLSPHKEQNYWGRAGLLGWIAFIVSAMSFDSFAIPNMWVVFGLITSATWIYSREVSA